MNKIRTVAVIAALIAIAWQETACAEEQQASTTLIRNVSIFDGKSETLIAGSRWLSPVALQKKVKRSAVAAPLY
ncbi:MAG: hypothetical protein ACR2RV_28815 [Verrucomicrobiales bacterium]